MLEILDRKVRQLHAALAGLRDADLTKVKPSIGTDDGAYYCMLDFSQGKSNAELRNCASLLLHNIASLKDHLKAWCTKQGRKFEGDLLINSNRDVALVHDLWNIDKHAVTDRKTRSGYCPSITNLRQYLTLTTGTEAGAYTMMTFDPRTGQMTTSSGGGGKSELTINGDVLDENGQRLGGFLEICERATAEWEATLRNAGVPIPNR